MSQQSGRGRAYWTALVEEFWAGPEMTQREYCRRRNLNYRSFGNWVRQLRAERDQFGSLECQFVEAEVPPAANTPLVRVQLGGVTVDFETLPPPAWIAELARYGGS